MDWRTWDKQTRIVVSIAGLGGVYYVAHLEQIPETGRIRFMDMSPKTEAQLAIESRKELLREFGGKILPHNHPLTRHIRRVVVNILDANDLGILMGEPEMPSQSYIPPAAFGGGQSDDIWNPDAAPSTTGGLNPENVKNTREWNLIVVNDDSVKNAMATYGNIIVFTGILPICKDEQGLSAVLGHEMGHVVLRHASERASSVKVLLIVASLLEILGLDFGISRLATTFLLELPNSRTQELEADRVGLRMMARACYDPRASPDMFERLGKLENSKGRLNMDFLYTHPTSMTRIKRLGEALPEAFEIRASSPACSNTERQFDAFSKSFDNFSDRLGIFFR
ncbi:hypothetical protein SCHPADRAFT_941515 [Schizopora paradoxa]|uniref:Peptidase M48 domain-containing protein n=1 Tax=Schizopora paradoxa TaxID=27342 RepID=A0A0H2RJS0_9AGAM|nr:hypothetical protein SCHPADRAFT_941515 [Schizopora paradoxa]